MKRFTETTKWRDPWFRRLSPAAKLLWQYLTDNCSCIGLIDLDLEAARFDIGQPINEKHLTELSDRVQALSNGKYFIPKFIQFQYGDLSTACPAHKPILKAIDQHQLTIGQKGYQYPSDRVLSTLQEKEKDQEVDQEKEKEGVQGEIQDLTKSRRPSLEEVRLFCAKSGLPESDADWFFHKCEGNGWTNGGKAIKRWGSTISAWKAVGYMPSQKVQPMLSASGGQPMKPLSLFEMKTILQAKEVKANDLKAKFSSEAALGVSWSNQEKRAEWVALRKEIKELNERIASYAR